MTELLQHVIGKMERLPEETQDALAAHFLAELDDELAWAAQFDATSDDQWDRLAEKVRQDIQTGATLPLEAVFRSRTPEK